MSGELGGGEGSREGGTTTTKSLESSLVEREKKILNK